MPLDPQDKERMRRDAIVRRRKAFVGLVWTAGATLVFGLIPALRFLLTIHLLTDLALGAFVAYLVWDRSRDPAYQPRHSAELEEPEEELELPQASQF